MAVSAQMLQQATTGNDAAWSLTFHTEAAGTIVSEPVLAIGRDDYYADISATLPANIEGGSYEFIVEGLTDDDYGRIARSSSSAPSVVRLYLYWRDTNSSVVGYLANLAGLTDLRTGTVTDEQFLVAELAITNVTRRSGAQRYEAVISARERVFNRLSTDLLLEIVDSTDPLDAIGKMVQAAGIAWAPFPESGTLPQAAVETKYQLGLECWLPLLNNVKFLGERVTRATGKYGRGVFLIRNGVLHIGQRPIPLEGAAKDIHIGNGLIEVQGHAELDASSQRRQFTLLLKGRPDLKPGDVVRFDPPDIEVGTTLPPWTGVIGELLSGPLVIGGGVSATAISLYVTRVDHRLGRRAGFVTTLSGVQIMPGEDGWDPFWRHSQVRPDAARGESSGEGRAAQAVGDSISAMLSSRRLPEVGEVRAVNTSGTAEPPGQTLSVWRGLAPSDGIGSGARRLAVDRPSPMPADGVSYLTPFAWGNCGLVLPRYPGTRVLVVHRNGERDDPVDAGALWESGHGPDSEPGDWWLSLPVGVPEAQRSSLADTDTPTEHSGPVSNDLIDADGSRVIEVGELTIRIGQAALHSAGERPTRSSESGAITIEHADGKSSLIMHPDGSVTLTASAITLDASDGDITLKANNVNVQVSGAMDVS